MRYRRMMRQGLFCLAAAIAGISPMAHPIQSGHAAQELGLPPYESPPLDSTDAKLVDLGRKLFFDKRLSADGMISCSHCHDPDKSFSDRRSRSQGVGGNLGTRNAPSLLNVRYQSSLFWDGRVSGLALQALSPLQNPAEHGLDEDRLKVIISSDPEYSRDFALLFRQEPSQTMKHAADALASFERSLVAGNSPFDRYYYGGDKTAMPAAAVRGLELFVHRANCASCHLIGERSALFSDEKFHASVTKLPADVATHLVALTRRVLDLQAKAGLALDQAITTDSQIAALGRFAVTFDPADIACFKTPSLRNVTKTAPYMHDGSISTLEEVVDAELYVRGSAADYPIVLTQDERKDLVAFLNALSAD